MLHVKKLFVNWSQLSFAQVIKVLDFSKLGLTKKNKNLFKEFLFYKVL